MKGLQARYLSFLNPGFLIYEVYIYEYFKK